MAIRFSFQQRDYWCGPACVQMLLGRGPQARLAKQLKTNARIGTTRKVIVQVLRDSGRSVTVYPRSTVKVLTQHVPAIVSYMEVEGEDHYAIASRVTKTQVIMHDPWHGPNYRLPIATFNRRWRNPKLRKKYTGWFVAFR